MCRAAWGALLAALGTGPLGAQAIAYEGSLSLSSGTYLFAQRTTTLGLSTGLAVRAGPVTFRATLPVWLQNSTLISPSAIGTPGSGSPTGPTGGGGVPSGGSSSGTVGDSSRGRSGGGGGGGGSGSGAAAVVQAEAVDVPGSAYTEYAVALGDPLVAIAWNVHGGDRVSLTLTGLTKIPATDTSGYGTGAWDVGLAAGSSVRLDGATLLGADVAWWHLGDMPGLDFRDPLSGSLSVHRLVGNGWGLMAFATVSTSAVRGYDPPCLVGGGVMRTQDGLGWGLQAGAGLTETSPDLSLSTFWRVAL